VPPTSAVASQLSADGVGRGTPLALVVVPGGVCLAWADRRHAVATADPAAVVRDVEALGPRWVWWDARGTASGLLSAGVRPRACWSLAGVGRLLHGSRRADPAAVWAAEHGLAEPDRSDGALDLLDLGGEDGAAVRPDGHLSRVWVKGGWGRDLDTGAQWAELALRVQQRQAAAAATVPDPRPGTQPPPLSVLTAHAESAAALLAVELEQTGLPIDTDRAAALITASAGARGVDDADEQARRRARDALVLQHFPDQRVDLRNPSQVRELLLRVGIDVPDTRSWRLQPHAATVPAVAALLAWRKAERIATTYGWNWLDQNVGADGRLRGRWGASDAAAGRMTAQAGLHNLPAELRPAVRAERGQVFVRADLGQVEPRVLATVSGDRDLARAAAEDDMYAPVAAKLRCDRPTAKVAVLAAMYGQTSGTAGAALADMERAYPRAIAYLRDAELAGREGRTVRTYGGRLLNADAEGSSMGLSARGR
jgi:DNA polymerase-1